MTSIGGLNRLCLVSFGKALISGTSPGRSRRTLR